MPAEQTARRAGLIYVSDQDPGVHRRRYGRGFAYRDTDGKPVRAAAVLPSDGQPPTERVSAATGCAAILLKPAESYVHSPAVH